MHICISTKLSDTTAKSCIWLLRFKLIKIKFKITFLVVLTIFQVLNSHMWQLATIFSGADIENFYYHMKLSEIRLL